MMLHVTPANNGTRASSGTRAYLDKAPEDVAAMFDKTAARYDFMNDVMTAGIDRQWRRAVVKAVAPKPGETILDLGAGTGMSSDPFADLGCRVVPGDFSLGMLQAGKRRRPDLAFVAADATQLPFPDNTFDAVTISFAIRNVVDHVQGLREMLRVTKPGGRLVVCEFSKPVIEPVRTVYQEGVLRAIPQLSRLSSNPDSYSYLAESIRDWPAQAEFADRIRSAGWTDVTWRNLTLGIVALHLGRKA